MMTVAHAWAGPLYAPGVLKSESAANSAVKAASNSAEPFHLAFGSHCETEKVYSAYGPAPLSAVGNSAAANPVPAEA